MENRQAGVLGVSRNDFTDAVKSVLRAHFNGLSGDDELSPSEEDYLAERVHRRIAGLVRQKSQQA